MSPYVKCVAKCRRPGPRRWLPSFLPCDKYARADHDTCWHHRHWHAGEEDEARLKLDLQIMKARKK